MSLDVTPTPSGPASEPTENEKLLAMLAHLLAFFCGGFIAPLVILAVKRDSKFVAFHAMQALLISIAWIGVLTVTFFGTVGVTTVPLLFGFAGWMVTTVVLAVRAKGGHGSALPGFGWLARRLADMVQR
jgi:uncharacterized membrane protein